MTFQPPPPVAGTTPAASASSTGAKVPVKPSQPDLITRYNLHNKLDSAEEARQRDQKGKAWSSDRDERQAALQRRRDEMILQARRKMEAKIAAESKTES